MGVKIVVVGASGNIGTAILRALQADEAFDSPPDVIGVSRAAPPREVPYSGVGWRTIDIAGDAATDRLVATFAGADVVISLAWRIASGRKDQPLRSANVDGTRRVLDAAAAAGVRHVIYLSSIGAYSPSQGSTAVDESWPTGGIAGSAYSQDKAEIERLLDRLETEHPNLVVTRLRPGLVLQRTAAIQIARYFIGPLVPAAAFQALSKGELPVLPLPRDVTVQFVHSEDVADAALRVLKQGSGGAFNLAAPPPMSSGELAQLLGARLVRTNVALLGAALRGGSRAMAPSWLDSAIHAPVMSTRRAAVELGWKPAYTAQETVCELLDGLVDGQPFPLGAV